MVINFWGVRGSIPTPGGNSVRYGGNTACIEVTSDGGHSVIVDAGTGLIGLSNGLDGRSGNVLNILLTHFHWDHVQGFPYLAQLYERSSEINIYAMKSKQSNLREFFYKIFNPGFHPVSLDDFNAGFNFIEFDEGASFEIGDIKISTAPANHSDISTAYRLDDGTMSCVITGDHEGAPHKHPKLAALMTNADVAVVDAMYCKSEYDLKGGWGHSHYEMWPQDAHALGVKRLFFFHHSPGTTDGALDDNLIYLRRKYSDLPVELNMAMENYTIFDDDYVPNPDVYVITDVMESMKSFSEELSRYNDMGVLLDQILTKARQMTNAEAGTVYLYKDGKLHFAYVHNDKLFANDSVNKYLYSNATLDINESNIAGYAAFNRKSTIVDDVYNIPYDRPYSFNSDFDNATGYKTKSVLAVPILSGSRELLGIIQLINRLDQNGEVQSFNTNDRIMLEILAINAGTEIIRATASREVVLRMLALTTLRDPKETEGHFMRVGAYAAVIYHRWAHNNGVDIDKIKYLKDQISVAAMLHDVGKVGIRDSVMLKPGKLTPEEFDEMKKHSYYGAEIFNNPGDTLEQMARTIAYHHHEKWNGSGYSGDGSKPMSGEGIPWEARITAIADVFDALISKRVYKDAWDFDVAVQAIKMGAGSHFDPDMVQAFLEITDTIKAITEAYPDK